MMIAVFRPNCYLLMREVSKAGKYAIIVILLLHSRVAIVALFIEGLWVVPICISPDAAA